MKIMFHTVKNIKHIFFAVLLTNIDNTSSKPVALFRGNMESIDLLKQFLKSVIIAKGW